MGLPRLARNRIFLFFDCDCRRGKELGGTGHLLSFCTMSGKREAEEEEENIAWRHSQARAVILADLMDESLPIDESICSAEEAWKYYSQMWEFADVPYSQFCKQLEKHREQVDVKFVRSAKEWAAFKRDRERYPVATHYSNGRPIFRHSPAYPLLQEDVYAGRHKNMTPSLFQATRVEYQEWGLKEFTQRIYQMERQRKFVNYLEKKRSAKDTQDKVARAAAYAKQVEARAQKMRKKAKTDS